MEERALQDAVRLHYVAYSRAERLLLLLVPDDRLDPLTAIGLGPDVTWFYAQFATAAQKGVVQYELPWG